MKNIKKIRKIVILNLFLLALLPCIAFFASCKSNEKTIRFYDIETEQTSALNFEDYIEGVVAGEIENDYPIEALKAQAVLARTFTKYFLANGKSKYDADISNDINEAQAYDKSKINDKIKNAVKQTKGETIKYEGDLIKAYYFSNAGGKTATLREGLSIDENLPYIISVETNESTQNSKNYSWRATFTKDDVLSALRNMGVSVSSISSIKKGEVGSSGRLLTLIIGSKEVNANTFRLNIGSTKFKSTLIDEINIDEDKVTFVGRGYGHGVGLSQEYAKVLAEEGKNYKEIIMYFFKDVVIE